MFCLFVLLLVLAADQARGADVKVVHQFAALVTAGNNPGSLIQGSDGNFYGVAAAGGANNNGVVFKVTPQGDLSTLHEFGATDNAGNNSDGIEPSAKLVEGSDGSFYGVAFQGGTNNTGTIFKVTASGIFTTLLSFNATDPSDANVGGAIPRAELIQGADGNFYGTTASGGANGTGVIFKVTSMGALTTLHDFSALDPSYTNTDGTSPYAALVQGSDGSFYGVASSGGAYGEGTAFKITPAGVFTPLYSFSLLNGSYVNAEGAQPLAKLIQGTDGNFYGLTSTGGPNGQGTAFQLTPGGTVTNLHSFSVDEGSFFSAALLQRADGNFYGVAIGGTTGGGTLFRLSPTGTVAVLHNFAGSDGLNPSNALVQGMADGLLYGVTSGGGGYNGGTFFEFDPAGSFNKLADFGLVSNTDGSQSIAGLIQAKDNNFYGTTNSGGTYGHGTIFRFVPGTRTTTVLHTFSAEDNSYQNSDGAFPNAGLVQGSDGNLYGTAAGGGANGTGTLFRITLAGDFTTLSSFDPLDENFSNASGAYPSSALIQATDGNFYGTATTGGGNANGTIFKMTPAGAMTVLYTFSEVDGTTNADGVRPNAGLVQGSDGNFYGMAEFGGTGGTGTIFQVTPQGGFTTLLSFNALDDGNYNMGGAYPTKSLIQGRDGSFYGTTGFGGTMAAGIAFKITAAGSQTTLHTFGTLDASYHNIDGVEPEASLIQGQDGSFYGTVRRGSTNNAGTIFRVTSSGDFSTLYSFGDAASSSGATPYANLVQGRFGVFYGTTEYGGNGAGTIFALIVPKLLGHSGSK